MQMILACLAAVLVGNLHTVRGLTHSQTTTPDSRDSTTPFIKNTDVQRIMQLYQNADFKDCVDKKKDICTKEIANTTEFNRETFCRILKVYSMCIENCSQTLRDGTRQGLTEFGCDGCGFLQGSLIVVILASFCHYFL